MIIDYILITFLCCLNTKFFPNFIWNLKYLRKHFKKNAYPTKFIDKCIAKFVNNIFVQKSAFTTVPKFELRISVTIFREYFQYHQRETEQMYQ